MERYIDFGQYKGQTDCYEEAASCGKVRAGLSIAV